MLNFVNILFVSTTRPVWNLMKIFKFNGGIRNSIYTLFRMDDLRIGKLIGEDAYGNKYYENPRYFYLRDRWVVYADYHALEYDATQVAPEWHGWLHHRTDIPPCPEAHMPHCYSLAHNENKSGTPDQYYPYTTVRPKIIPWNPSSGVQKRQKWK